MSFQRSVATRLLEGILRDYLADADVVAYWNSRVFIGPTVGNDSDIKVPQVNMLHAPNSIFTPGVTGVSDTTVGIVVAYFEKYSTRPFEVGGLNAKDRLEHLERLLLKGSYDTVSGSFNAAKPGIVIDPDNATSGNPTLKFLTVTSPEIREQAPIVVPAKDGKGVVAVAWSFLAIYQTRKDNVNLARA